MSLFFFFTESAWAYNLRQFTSRNGLSNSAILSMCQDKDGLLWLGSCEGLNAYDGTGFRTYGLEAYEKALSGNIIENILEADDNTLWIQTNYGLDRLDKRRNHLSNYPDFKGKNYLAKDSRNQVFVVKNDHSLFYFVAESDSFLSVAVQGLVWEDLLCLQADKADTWWAFMRNGTALCFKLKEGKDKQLQIESRRDIRMEEGIRWCFYDEGLFYYIDNSLALHTFDPLSGKKNYLYDLSAEIARYGDVSALISYRGNYFVGFKNRGLILLQSHADRKERFSIYETGIQSGIFCLIKDRYQDIVWIGTDGQGVYMYYNDQYIIRSSLSKDFPLRTSNPIRAIYLDKRNTLWLGTKGDGMVRIHDYDIADNTGKDFDCLQTSNSRLKDNSVYTIVPGKRDILWVGTEKGLNTYSYRDGLLHPVELSSGGKPVRYIHAVCELNDSTLWIAMVGGGILKARVDWQGDKPLLREEKRFVFDEGRFASNYFFTIYKENDSILWFGNRGYGAYRIHDRTGEVENLTFDRQGNKRMLNDVFSILKNKEGYWFGTGYGLAHRNEAGEIRAFDQEKGFLENSIHGMLEDGQQHLWLSTNRGLIRFHVAQNTFRTYREEADLQVTEFSDGAYFRHEPTGVLFFGGVNGFVSVVPNELSETDYAPPIQFTRLSIFGKESGIADFMAKESNDQAVLELNHQQNFFSLGFSAIDYIHGRDYSYFYRIKELSDHWVDNGASKHASFTHIAPGTYTLLVKYRNNITGQESREQALSIRILPPWYQTNWAHTAYVLLGLLLLSVAVRLSMKWYRMKKEAVVEKLNRQQREEVYESKLRFFTNITHELCTPLTLIAGPCEKILAYDKTDSYLRKYAGLIHYNAEKLNLLISELIEFRRLETGHKRPDIRLLPVAEMVRKIAESFADLSADKEMEYRVEIGELPMWTSDQACLSKIVTNLLSNAFKYTPARGEVSIRMFVLDNRLQLLVSNTGKGIPAGDLEKIFDRYTILDHWEGDNRLSSRNGLGLAICHSMVKLLQGEIRVESIPCERTTFSVELPFLEVNEAARKEEALQEDISPVSSLQEAPLPETPLISLPHDKNKQTIMVVDDDPEMLWFVTDLFADRYNLISVNRPEEVIPLLKQSLPDLLISDIMMPGIDGISLTKQIKADRLLSHLPIVLLSAKSEIEEQVRGIELGAEQYVTKPFHVDYLRKVVERLIRRDEDLKAYHHSPLSAFELAEGRLLHREDRELMEKVLLVLKERLSDPKLSVETLSESMGCSSRQLYRKLKEITDKAPAELIRAYRLSQAEKLLISSKLTVEEIIYQTGFSNRGNFFRLFTERYGMTPKKYREEKIGQLNKLTD